jgi:predicted phosphodiesterase
MKFNLLSDIHLEFCDLKLPGGDNLLLAGDIALATYLQPHRTDKTAILQRDRYREFFKVQCAKYDKAYYIMGNHEHYSGSWEITLPVLRDFLSDTNVTLLEKESVTLENDIVLWGATLWTDMMHNDTIIKMHARRGMNDYDIIMKDDKRTLHPDDTVADHRLAIDSLKKFLAENKDKKVIVMTHMAPSVKSSHPRYGVNNPLNYAYYTSLESIILDNQQIKVWVHGHTHDSHAYIIGETQVICNPRGYANQMQPAFPENENFDINTTFEV